MTSEGCNEWGVLLAQDQEHSCLSHQGGGGGGCHKQLVELVCSQGEGFTNLSREKVDEVLVGVIMQRLFWFTYLSEPVIEEEPDRKH